MDLTKFKVEIFTVCIWMHFAAAGTACCFFSCDLTGQTVKIINPSLHFGGIFLLLVIPGSFHLVMALIADLNPAWPFSMLKKTILVSTCYVVFAQWTAYRLIFEGSLISNITILCLSIAWLAAFCLVTIVNNRILLIIAVEEAMDKINLPPNDD